MIGQSERFSLSAQISAYISLPPMLLGLFLVSQLGELRRSVALVRLDHFAALQLLVGVGRPDDLTGLVIDNGHSSESITRTELAAPARSDSKFAACRRSSVRVGGGIALHNIGTRSSSARTNLDAKGPGARSVDIVTDALQIHHSPLRAGGHHRHAVSRGGQNR